MRKVFPDRPIVDIPNGDPIFHTIYDLDDRYQVPGSLSLEDRPDLRKGRDRQDPALARHLRRSAAASWWPSAHNMDLGDSWEHADNPEYPEKYSALGIRIALNYLVYSMTH